MYCDFRGQGKIILYVDNILFLGDTHSSLTAVKNIIKDFGRFSGLDINWGKSVLLPVGPLESPLPSGISQIEVVSKMKYLGIFVTKDPRQYIINDIAPLITRFRQKGRIWGQLPLSVAGLNCNSIKMIWMPQLLYVLHNPPIWVPKQWFQKIDTVFRALIWKKGLSRIYTFTFSLGVPLMNNLTIIFSA